MKLKRYVFSSVVLAICLITGLVFNIGAYEVTNTNFLEKSENEIKETEASDLPTFKEQNSSDISVSVNVSWRESFSSEKEMKEAADLIAVGTVVSAETELRGGRMVFTRNYIKLDSVSKGSKRSEEIIPVVQTGGTYGEHITYAPSEIPLLEVGAKYKLYLYITEYSEEFGQYYLILGGYQGIQKINKDGGTSVLSPQNKVFENNQTDMRSSSANTNTPLLNN